MIDLRSDTVTRPSEGMLAAMAAAPVGDDVYGEDPAVRALEEEAAGLFGRAAALFCVTGSMANLLGVWLHTRPGTEVLCDALAHIARAEMGAHSALHGVTMPLTLDVTFNGGYAAMPLDPGGSRIGFSARGMIKRSEFGLGAGIPAPGTNLGVSDLIEVIIEAEFTRPKEAAPPSP